MTKNIFRVAFFLSEILKLANVSSSVNCIIEKTTGEFQIS